MSVIVLNWNGRELLRACLQSLAAQTCSDFETLVVDNGSADGSFQALSPDFPDVTWLCQDENTGFCRGNNLAISEASGDLLLLLNNDAEVDADFVAQMVAAADRNPGHGMFAARVMMYDRPDVFDSTGLLVYPDGICRSRGWLEKNTGQYDSETEVFGPNGCAAMFRRQMLDDVGPFDERYFAYLEDLDLAFRGQLRGWGCLYVPKAVALHKKSMTSGYHSAFKAELVERNRIWNAVKLYPLRLLVLSPFYTLARYAAQAFATATGRGISSGFARDYSRAELLRILARAYIAAFRCLPAVWADRRQIQKARRLGALQVYRLMRRHRLPLFELALKD